MLIKRKSWWAVRGSILLSALLLLTACQGEKREITTQHSSAVVTADRTKAEGMADAALGRSTGWERKAVTSEARVEVPEAEASTIVEAEEPVEEVVAEEPVYVEEVPAEPVYEAAVEESITPAEPAVEEPEPAPVEPVYTYAPTYEEVVLPYPTEYIGNPLMDNDQVALRQVGVDGKEVYTWLHAYKDGVWESKHITKTSRFEPVPEIIEVGTNIVVVPEHSSYEQELAKMKELYPGAFQ